MNKFGALLSRVGTELSTGNPSNSNLAAAYRRAASEIRQIASSLESGEEADSGSIPCENPFDNEDLQTLLHQHLLQPINTLRQLSSTYSVLKDEPLKGLSAIANSFDTDAQGLENNAKTSDEYNI